MPVPAPTPTIATMLSVYDGSSCIGLILRCGPAGVEAFNPADQSIGLFESEHEAAVVLWRHARRQPVSNKRIDRCHDR